MNTELQKILYAVAIVLYAVFGNHVLAGLPSIDLDGDDSSVIGLGYYNECMSSCGDGWPLHIVDSDVLITDDDSSTIIYAEITILNPMAGDVFNYDSNQLPPFLFPAPINDHQLLVVGDGTTDTYQTALRTIMISNATYDNCGLRLVAIKVFDDTGPSNTAIATIDLCAPPIARRGIIYLTIRDAVSLTALSGATVSILDYQDGVHIFEAGELYVIDIIEGGYTVNVSLDGYLSESIGAFAEQDNDPSQPIPIYLCEPADADVTADGQLNAGDLLVATRIVLGQMPGTSKEICHGDMNGDAEITLPDLLAILQAIQSTP